MSKRRVKRVGRFPLSAGVMSRLAYARAKASGVRLAPLLIKAGVARHQIANRDTPLKAGDQIEFLNLIAAALDDDLLGFHLAQHFDLREGGLWYYVIASSGILLDALRRGARYSSIVNEGVAQKCILGKEIVVRFRYTGVSRHRDWHQLEFWATTLVRMCRQLTGVRLVPSHVHLVHKRKRGAAEMDRFFGSHIKFQAAVDEIAFSGRFQDLPLVKADPHLNRMLVAYSEEAISHRAKRLASTRSKVENAIFPLLPHEKIRVGQVARQLGMSQRSLTRHLAREGLNFSRLLDELRLDLARRYMTDEQLSISHVAWLLGYHDVASFSHAFKRWTGKAPTHAQKFLERRD